MSCELQAVSWIAGPPEKGGMALLLEAFHGGLIELATMSVACRRAFMRAIVVITLW